MAAQNESAFNIERQHTNLESKLIVTFEKMSEVIRVLLWNKAHALKISPIQLQLLIFIKYHSADKCKVGYLAREFNMTKATISDSVRVLVKKGLLAKETDSSDTRSFSLRLTKEGARLTDQVDNFTDDIHFPLLELSTEKKEVLLDGMMELIYKLQKKGIISLQRMCLTCRFFEDSSVNGRYCKLLREKLTIQNIRVDCPEYLVGDNP